MRPARALRIASLCAAAGCSFHPFEPGAIDAPGPPGEGAVDAPLDAEGPPAVIPGGGIGGGPVAGTMFVYVIDDVARTPIAGASVTVGAIAGATDANGLFIASGVGSGAQEIIASATSYVPQIWLGANGRGVTIDLAATPPATPPSATVTGTVDLSSFPIAPNHSTLASLSYSFRPTDQPIGTETYCYVTTPGPCSYSMPTRAGHVGLIATIYDVDSTMQNNPKYAVLTWASHPAIDVTAGSAQSGVALAPIGSAASGHETVALMAGPTGLPNVGAEIEMNLGSDEGDVYLDSASSAAAVTVPTLAGLGGTGYDVTSYAYMGQGAGPLTQSFDRAQTGAALATAAWLVPPMPGATTTASASWTNAAGATYHELAYTPSMSRTPVLEILSFDGTSTVAIPPALAAALPSGVTADLLAFSGAFDVTSFAFDDVAAIVSAEASVPVAVTAAAAGSGT